MARPREFDFDTALERAMQAFWAMGYEGTSLRDLLGAMHLTRGSLYKAFKDKKSLFLLVLKRYEDSAVDGAVQLLTDTSRPDGWDRIDALFASIIADVTNGDRRGCLLCTAAAEPASYDQEIANAVGQSLQKLRSAFHVALTTDQGGARVDADAVSMLLTTQYVGLRVLSRSRISIGALSDSVSALSLLRSS